MKHAEVKVWEEKVTIPTYEVGKPDKNPMFFEKRIYQGSSGVVYPYPVIEKIYDEKIDKEYNALFLENKYIKMMVLPELGGRIQMAYDKIKKRHFIYYNQVIKPALVGLTGPWISGGIEFNWPQHHRPSTFSPVDFKIEEHKDGSKTIWVNEIDRMFHTKGMAGFTLHPDKAYIEIKAKLFNKSNLPQTFLWWANPAVKVNDDYQSVFPPDVNAVFDHGKRDVSPFPIATGTYYKVDYSPGTDISRYKNIPVPTSYMAINSEYDFVGGYEHDTNAGLLHVADHHVSPGKKQWTWGYGDFGKAWDRNLTDEDGPYIELMTGMFTDNQPDFTWLMPNEEKSFTQYFLPYRELGMIKNASKDVLIAVDLQEDKILLKIQTTSKQILKVEIRLNKEIVFTEQLEIAPENVYSKEISIDQEISEELLDIAIFNKAGKEVLSYHPSLNKKNNLPEPAKPALSPAATANTEQLFLTGQHLEQYRHATFSPVPYYEKALENDPADIRNNNALGLWNLRRGQFKKSETYFRKAVETIIQRNPNPYDSEPYYNLGLSLKYQGKEKEAYDAFYKASWSNAWKDTGYFAVAQIDVARGDYELALEHVNLSLERNANNSKAYVLKAIVLRKLGNVDEALAVLDLALKRDAFNFGALFEKSLCFEKQKLKEAQVETIAELERLARKDEHNFIAYLIDYLDAGLFAEGLGLISRINQSQDLNPLVYYYTGFLYHKIGDEKNALLFLTKASKVNSYLCFPNRLEDVEVLETAIKLNPKDAKAPYYLGNLFYDKRQYDEAILYWELSVKIDSSFPTVYRNLGIALFNKKQLAQEALNYFEKAFALDPTDARVLMELDQLQKRLNKKPEDRLAFLESHLSLVMQRDDLYLERTALYNFLGKNDKAHQLISKRKFHPWEGGEGKVSGQYIYALVEIAIKKIEEGYCEDAIHLLKLAQVYPHNLGEGKLFNAQENDILYHLGCAYNALNREDTAKSYFEKATQGLSEPTAAIFYNDQQPDKIFYQGLAYDKLGDSKKANKIFQNLIKYGRDHLKDKVEIDYFAVSLPNLLIFDDDLNLRNQVHCLFLIGLGQLGLKEITNAKETFLKIMSLDAAHPGAKNNLDMIVKMDSN